ncbi:phage-related baseplate assembly protein [Caedimonas varicaedens]|uniref:Phage-related baseplate assembly protein n=1 Tax=Caedimonas varicaedens TaxID=1629334 RepID=A0A0K8MDT9_9PROT|nr:phage-related baseplate assembly protein [Caedimonas varicaedens]
MATTTLVESQKSVSLRINTPLGENAVIMESFQGQEILSQPFEYTARLVSNNPQISFDDLMGKLVTISIDCHGHTRYFNGVVGQFKQLITAKHNDDNATYYEAKIYPLFWMLKFVQDCRIFQNKTPMEIIKIILNENAVRDFKDVTRTCGNKAREYCVQYNETAFDFVSRLLEEEGIFYFFEHQNNKHILVFGEDSSAYSACEVYEEAAFEIAQPSADFLGHITACHLKQQVVSKSHTLNDYNFTLASTNPLSKSFGQGEGGEIYAYPGHYDQEDKPEKSQLETFAKLQLEKSEAPHKAIEGTSTIPFFLPGHRFTLKGHPRADANREYVLHTVEHACHMDGRLQPQGNVYQNAFQAFPSTTPFRPPSRTRKPRIYSTQTARVTGPENEEIWTDKYGRIKVIFHWDRLSPADQESSCWVRVAEGWAGNNWGILFTPRIGMEVVVTFIEGNPDRPLVIGSVYNSDNMPPYLPEQPTKSTIKSRSTKGGEGFNEFRFEDLKGSEQIYLFSQKDRDFRVKENVTDWIEKGSYWFWIDQGSREMTIGGTNGVPKTTPEGQALPAGIGDDNLTMLSGSKTAKLLGQGASYNMIIPDGHHFLQIEKGTKYTIGGELNEFIKIEQGKHETHILQGEQHTVINQGNSLSYIETGNYTVGITSGNLSQEIVTGNMLFGVTSGDIMSYVETGMAGISVTTGTIKCLIQQGNYIFRIKEGNSDSKINQGNETLHILQGNQTLKIDQGNQETQISVGNRSIKVDSGNEDHFVNGNYDHHVVQNYSLKVDGNLSIIVTGTTKIESVGSIDISTPQSIRISAGESINMSAGMSLTQEAGTTITQEAGAEMTLSASLEMEMNALSITQTAEMAYNVEAGAEASITAGANMTITAATVFIA